MKSAARGVICLSTELAVSVDCTGCPSPPLFKAEREGQDLRVRLGRDRLTGTSRR